MTIILLLYYSPSVQLWPCGVCIFSVVVSSGAGNVGAGMLANGLPQKVRLLVRKKKTK